MADTKLTEEQIGFEASGDTPRRWPDLDVNGRTYSRQRVMRYGISGGRFVAVPNGQAWRVPEQYKREPAKTAHEAPVEPPVSFEQPASRIGRRGVSTEGAEKASEE